MITTENKHLALLAQNALATRGYYTAVVDGDWGALSQTAFDQYVQSLAPAVPQPLPLVHGAATAEEPRWLVIARRELGTTEIPGDRDNPRIVEYHQATSLKATDDETAWCSAFVNWCMREAGLPRTDSAMARSWLKWGTAISAPRPGCVVVFSRGAYPQGHVAFFVGREGDRIRVLGGNQGNRVSIAANGTERVLGYRWPAEAAARGTSGGKDLGEP